VSTIWKYPVPLYKQGMASADPMIDMPEGAEVLALQTQDGHPTLWARVEPSRPKVPRRFAIVGTGHAVPDDAGAYVGTWQSALFVFHLFEVAP
jgi:hypothetical protein